MFNCSICLMGGYQTLLGCHQLRHWLTSMLYYESDDLWPRLSVWMLVWIVDHQFWWPALLLLVFIGHIIVYYSHVEEKRALDKCSVAVWSDLDVPRCPPSSRVVTQVLSDMFFWLGHSASDSVRRFPSKPEFREFCKKPTINHRMSWSLHTTCNG